MIPFQEKFNQVDCVLEYLNKNANKLDSGIAKLFGLGPTECFVKEQSMEQFIKPSYEVFQKIKCSNVGKGLLSKLDNEISREQLTEKCNGSIKFEVEITEDAEKEGIFCKDDNFFQFYIDCKNLIKSFFNTPNKIWTSANKIWMSSIL